MSAATVHPVTRRTTTTTGGGRGLAWAAWRYHRSAVLTVLAVLAVLGAVLLVNGLVTHAAFERAGLAGCPASSPECTPGWKSFLREYENWPRLANMLLLFFPGALGAFVGGPVVAREFEAGTFRFAWTQGAGRGRWTAAGLAVTGTAVAVMAALFGLLLSWWNRPLASFTGVLHPDLFVQGPPAMAGQALLGFGVGALAGAVLRRTVAAVGTGLAVSITATFVAQALRAHYRTPLVDTLHTVAIGPESRRWVLTSWAADPAGHRISDGAFSGLAPKAADMDRLLQQGYTMHLTYHPESRYWPFQFVELGWMAAVGVAACAAALWWVRRKAG